MAVDFGNVVSKPTVLLSNYPSFLKSRSASIGILDRVSCKNQHKTSNALFARNPSISSRRNKFSAVPRSTGSSSSDNNSDHNVAQEKEKVPFGYSRKDVLLIGLGVTLFGIGLKSGLEYGGMDPLQAGNVVQLVLVLGLTVGWISTYMFRVSNKDMTYAQQLRDYEKKVMEKRLEGLTEAELEALLEQVEEEKRQIPTGEQV